jgi:DNA-binding transcriptional ArsR family regulator
VSPSRDDDDEVFKALADASRRALLDRLFARSGQTLGELCDGHAMTRFGVMKHLRVLERAGLVVTRKVGREKLHYLDPVPIRLVHDRWVSKFAEPHVAALADLKHALEAQEPAATPAAASATPSPHVDRAPRARKERRHARHVR